MSNNEFREYSKIYGNCSLSNLSDLDERLYRYFWLYEESEESIKIIEPNITDVIKHFTKKFPIYTASFSTSVDWWTVWEIIFKDWFIPDVREEYKTEYIHDRTLMEQSDATKQFIVTIAEFYFWYWFQQES